MKRVILQLWEESENDNSVQPDGCSIHINEKSLSDFTNSIYSDRSDEIPSCYERVVGSPIEVDVVENIYNILEKMKTIRLQQYEMNNLINLNEIRFDDNI
jgi:hypothetical protein